MSVRPLFSPPEEERENPKKSPGEVCFLWKEKPKWAKSGGRSVEEEEEELGRRREHLAEARCSFVKNYAHIEGKAASSMRNICLTR